MATLDQWGNATLTTDPTTHSLPVGCNYVTASYSGDGNFTSNNSTGDYLDVQMATTTTITSSSPNPSVCTEPVTLTATVSVVSPGSGIPTGTVEFYDGTSCLGCATVASNPLDGSDSASFPTSGLSVGDHSISATYFGDGNTAASTSTSIDQDVYIETATTIASSANPAIYSDEPVTLTAQVSTVGPVPVVGMVPTGTVDFFDTTTNTDLGSGTPNGLGDWTLQISQSTPGIRGDDEITATYSGDGSFAGGTSSPLSQEIELDLYWDPRGSLGLGGTGTWDVSTANWSRNPSGGTRQPWGNGSVAIFGGQAGTVTLSGQASPATMEFATDGYTISPPSGNASGGAISLAEPGTSFDVSSGLVTIDSAISGAGGLAKEGNGTLMLGGYNTFTGGTTVDKGTLQLDYAGTLGAETGGLTVNDGTLELNNSAITVGSLSGDDSNGAIIEGGSSAAMLTVDQATNTSYAGTIQGGYVGQLALTKAGDGTLTLSGQSSYLGDTAIDGGTLGWRDLLPGDQRQRRRDRGGPGNAGPHR